MAAPPNFEEGQSTYRPPRFNGQYYGWWKTRMHDFIMAEESKLWDVICDGPFVPTKIVGDPTAAVTVPTTRKEFNDADQKAIEKNFCAKKILVCGIGPDEYNRIYAFSFYLYHQRASLSWGNPTNKLVRKILSVLPSSWESKVNAITEAKDLQELTIDELVGNLKTYEMKKMKDNERREPKREKNMVLKTDINDSSGEDGDIAYFTRRFQKMVRRNGANLATWGDSSSESKEENDNGDSSMMAVESEATEYDSIFALMAQSDDDDDEDNDEVNFLDVQRNLKSYSPKKTHVFGEAEQTRDDLGVIVVDLKETIENLKKEKDALNEKIANIEHERDDLMVVVVELKETIECVRKEKEVLTERVANIEHERDDLLVEVVDLKETIGELKMESRPEISQKGKELASEAHIKLESMGETCRELGSKGKILPTTLIANTLLYLTIGFALTMAILGALKKTGTVKGSSLQWYMDNGCSKHMTGSTNDFLPHKALQGGSVSFENGKKGYILGVGKIGKSLSHSIENVYYVNGLKYSLLSVSQICDKGNKVEFVLKICTVTNLMIGEVVLVAKRYKNIYVAYFNSLQNGDLSCLSDVDDDAELWHRRLSHASFTLLNRLVRKDLVRGLTKSSFKDQQSV
ncbi:uncharacterized protein [Nicotiana sylvestris]|uniref:uncharacterized protein n=1 Tax=Nicotiana sylvestris TaxID=4096 RepID=UPI00388C71BC